MLNIWTNSKEKLSILQGNNTPGTSSDKSYKRPEPYQDKTALVVGIGSSGLETRVELSRNIAKQVYISGRGTYM